MTNKELLESKKLQRIGEIGYNISGSKMMIIEYNNKRNIRVQFQDEHKYSAKAEYNQFKKGSIKNPYYKSIFGIGYIGEGNYKVSQNCKATLCYQVWQSMFERCYNKKTQKYRNLTYVNCTVCEEWHNFQVFGKWYDKNYYEVDNEKMELDKDILHKGNKVYSPENCVFVSNDINCLFTKHNSKRGKYPIGVSFHIRDKQYSAHCAIGKGKQKWLGYHNTPEEAFKVYKKFKESYIKDVADKYEDRIPKKLYDAMYRYIVEITD